MAIRYTLSEDKTIKDIESIYRDTTLKQDFYNETYGDDCSIKPYEQIADLIIKIFKPKKHMDIGCGKGLLVEAMISRDVKSYGIDFSEALINAANPNILKYLSVGSTETFLQEVLSQDFDLISYMEVFEHLPISILERTVKDLFAKFNGNLFFTIPSHGLDPTFNKGLFVDNGNWQWQRDMIANTPFRNIVLENGKPHCGHITLASYRWWTEFFLFHGFLRNTDLEKKCLTYFNDIITRYKWKPYVLKKMKSLSRPITIKDPDFLGLGWHDYEDTLDCRWTDGHATIYYSDDKPKLPQNILIHCSAPDVNIGMDTTLLITLDRLTIDNNYSFHWKPIAGTRPIELKNRGELRDINAPFISYDEYSSADKPTTWRIKLLSPHFCPKKYGLSLDDRNLGIMVHSIMING